MLLQEEDISDSQKPEEEEEEENFAVKGTASSHVMSADDLIRDQVAAHQSNTAPHQSNNAPHQSNIAPEQNDVADQSDEVYDDTEEALLLSANRLAMGSCVYDGKTYMSAQQVI